MLGCVAFMVCSISGVFCGQGFRRVTHTPRSKCGNAVDKGDRPILYGKAERKELRMKTENGN